MTARQPRKRRKRPVARRFTPLGAEWLERRDLLAGTASIAGMVWDDANGNGTKDAGEAARAGVTVYLDLNDNKAADAGEPTTLTAADGKYSFTSLDAGNFVVREVPPANTKVSYPLVSGRRLFAVDTSPNPDRIVELNPLTGAILQSFNTPAGTSPNVGLAFDGTTLFFLSNTNDTLYELNPTTGAVLDSTVLPSGGYGSLAALGGVVYVLRWVTEDDVLLFDPATNMVTGSKDLNSINHGLSPEDALGESASTGELVTVDNQGDYVAFLNASTGARTRSFGIADSSLVASVQAIGDEIYVAYISRIDVHSRATGAVTRTISMPFSAKGMAGIGDASGAHRVLLTAGQAVTAIDFGNQVAVGALRGTKWRDSNANGIRDVGEPGLSGKTVYLDLNNNAARDANEPFTRTGIDGSYEFVNVLPGNYVIRQEVDATFQATFPAFTNDRLFSVNIVEAPDRIYELNPLTGATINSFASPLADGLLNSGMAFDGQKLYYLNDMNDVLYELNPNTGAVLDSTQLPTNGYEGLAAMDGVVYVQHSSGGLITVFNPVTNTIVRTITMQGYTTAFISNGLGEITGPNRLLATGLFGELLEIDPVTGAINVTFNFKLQIPYGFTSIGQEIYAGNTNALQNPPVPQIDVYSRSGSLLRTMSGVPPVFALGAAAGTNGSQRAYVDAGQTVGGLDFGSNELQPLIARDDNYTVPEDGTLSITAPGLLQNDSSSTPSSLTATLLQQASPGVATVNSDGSFTFIPAPNFNGSQSFTYRASDGSPSSVTAVVTITVTPVNDPPTSVSLFPGTVAENAAGATVGTLSASDIDVGDTFTFTVDDTRFEVTGSPANQLRLKAGVSLDFEAAANVKLAITATDAGGLAKTETLTVTVVNANEAPTAVNLSNASVPENAAGAEVGTITVTDPDAGDTHTLTVDDSRFELTDVPATSAKLLKLKANQRLDYEMSASVPLVITATDAGGLSKSQTVTIAVTNVGDSTDLSLDASGNLLITDAFVGGSSTNLAINFDGTKYTLRDTSTPTPLPFGVSSAIVGATGSGTSTVTIPATAITGTQIIFNVLDGNDTLTVDLSTGDAVPAGGIKLNGGNPTTGPGDKLIITGGNQGTVTYSYVNAHDGSVAMSNFGTVTYTGLEPIVNSGNATDVIFNLPPVIASFNTAMLEDDGTGGNGLSRLSAATFETTDFANPSGSVTINRGNSGDTLTVQTLPDLKAGLTIGTAANKFGSVTFAGALTLAANRDLLAYADGTVSVSSNLATSGTGNISLISARDISLLVGSSVVTATGDITLEANQQSPATPGDFIGINVAGNITSTSGNVQLAGSGGNTPRAGGFGGQVGISLSNANIQGGGAGKLVALNGTGGPSTGDGNSGVVIQDSVVGSLGGDVTVKGVGGGVTASSSGDGVAFSGQIKPGGLGSVSIRGTGKNRGVAIGGQVTSSGGDVNVNGDSLQGIGVEVAGGGQISAGGSGMVDVQGRGGSEAIGVYVWGANSLISSNGGNVQVTGSCVLDSNSFVGGNGVVILDAGQITAGLNGRVTVSGTAANLNSGVLIRDAKATSSGAPLTVTGTSGGQAIRVSTGGEVSTTGGAPITLAGDTISIDSAATIAAGAGIVELKPTTGGKPVNLGASDSSTQLGLTNAELDRITAGTLRIGNVPFGGTITVSAPINVANNATPIPTLHLFSGGAVVDANTAGADITVANLALEGFGGPSTLTTLTTQVSNLAAKYVGAGDFKISNNGPLTIVTVDGLTGVVGDGGSIEITVAGALNVTAVINSPTGPINLTAAGNDQLLTINAFVNSNGNGTFTSDKMAILETVNFGVGTVTVLPDNGDAINLGSVTDNAANTLELSSAELTAFFVGTVQIGNATSGPITVSADVASGAGTNVSLMSGGAINITGGYITAPSANLALAPGSGGAVHVAKTGTDVSLGSSGTLTFANGSDLAIAINGVTVDTQYEQLNVVGKVNLTGVDLVLSNPFPPPGGPPFPVNGQSFKIVSNDDTDAILGEFNNLPEGKVFNPAVGALDVDFVISYHGGDGNDVVITATNLAPTLATIANPAAIDEDVGTQTIGLSGISPGGTQTQTLTVTVTSSRPDVIPDPAVQYVSPAATGSLTYQPLPNQFGTAVITVTVKDSGGTASGSDSVVQTFTVTVTPVNDPPSFDKGGNQSVGDGSGARAVSNWATNLAKGPATATDEATQTLDFIVTNSRNDLFAVQPKVAADGTLSFSPKANTRGTATVTVSLHDSGGGNDTSLPQTFTIEVTKNHPWFNASKPLDVDNNLRVEPLDALMVINYLNAGFVTAISSTALIGGGPGYLDTTDNNLVEPLDALLVINALNAGLGGEGEQQEAGVGGQGSGVERQQAETFSEADLFALLALDASEAASGRRRRN